MLFRSSETAKRTRSFGTPSPYDSTNGQRSSSTAEEAYIRYIQAQEITVTPRHKSLQRNFRDYISSRAASRIQEDKDRIDIQFDLDGLGHVLAEVKPCDSADVRYAVRTAIGQLRDYEQRHRLQSLHLLIVLEIEPCKKDANLALRNRIGIAYPYRRDFVLKWPT